jgi:ParB family chromosome partitioning protein
MMLDLGSTVSEIAEKTGFSKATVKHRVEIAKLDGEKVKERIAKGATLFDFIELEKVSDPKSKASLLEVIGTANFNYSLKDTLDKEEAKRNKARILEPIEAKLKPLPKGAATWQYESVYHYIPLRDDTKTEDIKLPRDAKFYRVTGLHVEIYGNMRDGYVTNPNKEKDEAAKKEDFERRTKALAEVCERMYSLRLDFMQNITKTELNKAKEHILKTALGCIAYRERPSEDVIVSMLGISEDDIDEDEDASQYLIETFQSTSLYKMFVMTYAALDQPGLTWHSANSWNATIYPPEGDDAERLYPFLEGFGYQESDEEKQIIDGSHPLYVEGAGAGNE